MWVVIQNGGGFPFLSWCLIDFAMRIILLYLTCFFFSCLAGGRGPKKGGSGGKYAWGSVEDDIRYADVDLPISKVQTESISCFSRFSPHLHVTEKISLSTRSPSFELSILQTIFVKKHIPSYHLEAR